MLTKPLEMFILNWHVQFIFHTCQLTLECLVSLDSTRLTKSLSCPTSSPNYSRNRVPKMFSRRNRSRKRAVSKSRNRTTWSRWSRSCRTGSSPEAGTCYFDSRSASNSRRIGSGSRRSCVWRPRPLRPATCQRCVYSPTIIRLSVYMKWYFSRRTTSVRWAFSSWTSTANVTPSRFNRLFTA